MTGHRCPTTAALIVCGYFGLIFALCLLVEVFGK